MGVYLSKPVTQKETEQHEDERFIIGASAMQGWRQSMEDAHVVSLNILPNAAFFAVFDGHGGKEVSKYCAAHMAEELVSYQHITSNPSLALTRAFHRMDECLMAGGKELEEELKRFAGAAEHGEDDAEVGERSKSDPGDSLQSLGLGMLNGVVDGSDSQSGMEMGRTNVNGMQSSSTQEEGEDVVGELDVQRVSRVEALELFQKLLRMRQKEQALQAARAPQDPTSGVAVGNGIPPAPPLTLPEHSIHAGCTSIAVLALGRQLYVANAGDSRGVLCRAGSAVALSEDHKPMQEKEFNRIKAAGGYVTPAGRVNGNLNLSRSIGDLKYKGNAEIPPEAQIITAEPDVLQIELLPHDEFMILACDGIWDCYDNQAAVDFVRERLGQGFTPAQVAEAMFDDCLAEDPQRSSGVGTDNMTCLIVCFKKGFLESSSATPGA